MIDEIRLKAVAQADTPALIVVESKSKLSPAALDRLEKIIKEAFIGSPFEGVKTLVMDEGLRMRVLDKAGADRLEEVIG